MEYDRQRLIEDEREDVKIENASSLIRRGQMCAESISESMGLPVEQVEALAKRLGVTLPERDGAEMLRGEVVANMIRRGKMSVETISGYTGMPVEQVEALAKELGITLPKSANEEMPRGLPPT